MAVPEVAACLRHAAVGTATASATASTAPPAAPQACTGTELFDRVDRGNEPSALSHRTQVAELLAREARRRRGRFRVTPQAEPAPGPPSARATSSRGAAVSQVACDEAGALDPHLLLEHLRRSPRAAPVTAEVAHRVVSHFQSQLESIESPVIDLRIPKAAAGDGKLVVVGDTHGQLLDVLHMFDTQGPPSESVMYLFNGDIVDRGRYAVEIWMLICAFKRKYPNSVHVLRGNHENEQMVARPLKMGGGFAEDCLAKYSGKLLAAFQRVFKLLPLFAVIDEEIFVVHGGLFRNGSVTLETLRNLPKESWRRNYPNPLTNDQLARGERWTEHEEIIFDAQWADPHFGKGAKQSPRGRVAVTFGEDVTAQFLDEAGLSMVIRSHRVPQSGRGFELDHGGRLMTLFSASRYGGVLHNKGAVAVLRRADGDALRPGLDVSALLEPPPPPASAPAARPTTPGAREARDAAAENAAAAQPATLEPPLVAVSLALIEHDVDSRMSPAAAAVASAATAPPGASRPMLQTVCEVRRLIAQHAREFEASVEKQAVGALCAERERLWRRCRSADVTSSGVIGRAELESCLGDICGEIAGGGWARLLQKSVPDLGEEVAYGDFLTAPRVRWYYQGISPVAAVARATAQAELRLGGLSALFDGENQDGMVMPDEAAEALGHLLPTLRAAQRSQLAAAWFGKAPVELSALLHQVALFADPPTLSEPWMRPALKRLAELIEQHYGPPPLHGALLRFFRSSDRDRSDLLTADEFVRGLLKIGAPTASGDGEVPVLHSGRLYKLFSVVDNNHTGTVSFLELLLALDHHEPRPVLPDFPALEGQVPALLLVHKNAVMRLCQALDPQDAGFISVANFSELVDALAQVVNRPLTSSARSGLEDELRFGLEELAYHEALAGPSFEVVAVGAPWKLQE